MERDILTYLSQWHARSRGYDVDPPAILFPRILVGPPCYLTPAFVKKHAISHVINCAEPGLTPRWLMLPGRYVNIQTQDSIHYPLLPAAYSFFSQFMTRFLRDPSCTGIYIHCAAGINRSATLAHAYVVQQFGVPLPKLLETSMRQRPCMLQNPGFVIQLIDFVKKHT